MIKLIRIEPSNNKNKKWSAFFNINDKEKKVDFGYKSKKDTKNDYTLHNDKQRRKNYLIRHKKDLNTNQPYRAGYLSIFILWNDKSLEKSINIYKSLLNKYNKGDKNVFKKYYEKLLNDF